MAVKIAIVERKGGVGKTTLAAHIAGGLALAGDTAHAAPRVKPTLIPLATQARPTSPAHRVCATMCRHKLA